MLKNKLNVMALSVLFVLFFFAHDAQSQTTYLSESFTGTTAPDWTLTDAAGTGGPVLTKAEGIDRRDGWLRLTTQDVEQNSLVYYNSPITTQAGLIIEFDFVIWSENVNVADGFAVVLFNADADPVSSGGWGGSLGYAQHIDFGSVGMNGGLIAFGFDTYGNFSNSGESRIGGFAEGVLSPHAIVVRGEMGENASGTDNRTLGYEYIDGEFNPPVFSTINARRRRDANVYSVKLTMTDLGAVTIEMGREGVSLDLVFEIEPEDYSIDFPPNIKLGFTAATGSVSSYQEVRNLVVTPYDVEEVECWVDDNCTTAGYVGYECLGYVCQDPSLIELGSMEATWDDDAVLVNWITDTELDNAYFNVYRAESIKTAKTEKKNFLKKLPKWLKSKKAAKKGPYVKINAAPIPALGESPYGAFYEVIDTNVQYGKRYWYKLEDVDLFGVSTQHGPCGPVSAWEDCSYMP